MWEYKTMHPDVNSNLSQMKQMGLLPSEWCLLSYYFMEFLHFPMQMPLC